MDNPFIAPKVTGVDRLLSTAACIEIPTLQQCPPREWQQARGLGMLISANFLYIGGVLSLLCESLFAPPGEFRPELVFGSFFLAFFLVILIDREMLIRPSFYDKGVAALKKAGIDLGKNTAELVRTIFSNLIRFLLAFATASLLSLFGTTTVLESDIHNFQVKENNRINFHIVGPATALVDDAIARAREAEKVQSAEVDKLAANVASLRQIEIDPASGDAQLQMAQQELSRLTVASDKAELDKRNAESFATAERGGLAKAPGNSGHPGAGPKYRAALEEAANAKNYAEQAGRAQEAARSRVDALRDKLASVNEQARQKAQDQLPGFEASLDAENARLATSRDQLKTLIEGREAAIRKAVENAPDFVPLNTGFLARVSALEALGRENPRVMIIMILLEIVSFCLEVAAILATMAGTMSHYSALIARDSYMGLVKIADQMAAQLDKPPVKEEAEAEFVPAERFFNERHTNIGGMFGSTPFENAADTPPRPTKRGRGRPRKHPNVNGSQVPVSQQRKNGNQADKGEHQVGNLPGNGAGL